MQNGYENIKSAGAAELIAISADTPAGASNTRNNENITYLLLSDDDKLTIDDYNAFDQNGSGLARPTTYIIDESGKIAWKDLGARYGHRTSSDQIITALNELESQ